MYTAAFFELVPSYIECNFSIYYSNTKISCSRFILFPVADIQLGGAAVLLEVEVEVWVGEEQVVELLQRLGHDPVADVRPRRCWYPVVHFIL